LLRGSRPATATEYASTGDSASSRPASSSATSTHRFKIERGLGAAEVELGLYDDAARDLTEASRLCEEQSEHTEAVRARWLLARIPLRSGRHAEAAEALRQPLAESRQRGMLGMESGIALDLAEAYALMTRPADVARICASLVETFVSRGQLTSAMTAFAFLRDAASVGETSPEQIQHVRRSCANRSDSRGCCSSRHPRTHFRPYILRAQGKKSSPSGTPL
jgi:hypothetical protein